MSLTKVALTYKRQVIQSAQKSDFPAIPAYNAGRLSLDNDIGKVLSPKRRTVFMSMS
ncbi:MAG: hypothetical protein ABJH06_01790 [Paraglaciecola sp.]|uniref:hypothetical protein n=1 Tax=Paraglaciecola sp. TaxID=1920173 RepID=UPI00329A6C69